MGAAITTTNPADFSNRSQTYFSRQLLKAAEHNLKLGQYGQKKDLPANSSTLTMRFFRPRRAKKGTATTGPRVLTEGTPPTENAEVAVGYVDVTLRQRGDITSISDVLSAIDLFNTLEMYSKTLGADAALDFDFVCSHAIISKSGTADADGQPNPIPSSQSTMYNSNGRFERFAGVPNSGNSANDFASLAAASASDGKITRAVHLGAVTQLKGVGGRPSVPMINGRYVAFAPPEIIQDMRQDSTWVAKAIFNNGNERISLFPWAEFELDGCIFVEHSSPFIETGAGTYGVYAPDTNTNLQNNIYSVLYLGSDAFGVPKLGGMKAGSDPRAPSLYVLDKADKSDPLNQKTTIGWKAMYQATLLLTNETTDFPHLVVQRCRTTMT